MHIVGGLRSTITNMDSDVYANHNLIRTNLPSPPFERLIWPGVHIKLAHRRVRSRADGPSVSNNLAVAVLLDTCLWPDRSRSPATRAGSPRPVSTLLPQRSSESQNAAPVRIFAVCWQWLLELQFGRRDDVSAPTAASAHGPMVSESRVRGSVVHAQKLRSVEYNARRGRVGVAGRRRGLYAYHDVDRRSKVHGSLSTAEVLRYWVET
ncbi:hypothetical protein C8Q74DRAFT_1278131 [Fomes fomentarius]|nr:hypothetical protein C8Q74DRAFT_1278131 [Fomes fomentarius]